MTLAVGARLGPYEIVGPIGAGGMGEVYRARDTKLNRDVAIKVLPDLFANDPERLARFQREAQTLAALNHPNIAHIHGLEESGGVRALVMELVEGEDLAQRIARGRIPLDEVLPIARQIAEALEAAHEQGIIHRDLKPANIKVRDDGTVKVLDFGLAKALGPNVGQDFSPAGDAGSKDPAYNRDPGYTNSPTITSPAMMTGAGMILGTAAYMAPEQARGKVVDRRADIWAFGCVLFEMLAGQRAFGGDDVSMTLAASLMKDPDWAALPSSTPPAVRRLVARCLKKDPKARLRDIGDARLQIEEQISGVSDDAGAPAVVSALPLWQRALPWALTSVLLVGLALLAFIHFRETAAPVPPAMRVDIYTPATSNPLFFALSPDGRQVAFVASGEGASRLWLRTLDKSDAVPLAGTEGANRPFWSPDSRSVGFFANRRLLRIDVSGGPPQVLACCDLANAAGGAWNADGTIVFARGNRPLSRMAASGGEPTTLIQLDPPRRTALRYPRFLPDGRRFLFHTEGNPETSGIYLGSLDGGEPKRLTAAETAGEYLSPGYVVFVRQGTLVARRLDIVRGELTGDPVTLADPVASEGTLGGFSVSADGRVAYRSGGAAQNRLAWFDRSGKALGVLPDPGSMPELSPDGKRVAVNNAQDVWLKDLVRGSFSRFTTDAANDIQPVWSPEGTRIAFVSNRKGGVLNLYLKPSSGVDAEELLVETLNDKRVQDWTTDGQFLLYTEDDPKTGDNLWALEMTGNDRKSRVVTNAASREVIGQFSPDHRWVAYDTDESGPFQIVVQPFPEPTGKWQVSTSGGRQPRWRADGKELYFIAPDGKLMAVPIPPAQGSTFEFGAPVALFQTRIAGGGNAIWSRPQYTVSSDGRFLINEEEESTTAPITLLLNWSPNIQSQK